MPDTTASPRIGRYLNVSEASDHFSVSRNRLYELLKEWCIRARKLSAWTLLERAELDRFPDGAAGSAVSLKA